MDTHLHKGSTSDLPTIHVLPCKINHDGKADVSKYFSPICRKDEKDLRLVWGTFRGRGIHGKKVDVPSGYEGIRFKSKSKIKNDTEEVHWQSEGQFFNLTMWKLGREATNLEDDPITTWQSQLQFAEKINKPLSAEDVDDLVKQLEERQANKSSTLSKEDGLRRSPRKTKQPKRSTIQSGNEYNT
eukprot:m.28907 g.28907  ORF g.28907 m.28907 type:complete len:185 (-) comp6102_c0_seq3:921-1475(-)